MAADTSTWIVIPNWGEFQHYKNRDPTWIKAYTRLLSDADYLALSFHVRGVLVGLWLAYARSDGQLLGSTSTLTRQLGGDIGTRVTRRDLRTLNHAGFIRFSASKPLALRYQAASPEKEAEKEAEKEKSLPSSNGYVDEQAGRGDQIEQQRLDPLAELRRLSGAA